MPRASRFALAFFFLCLLAFALAYVPRLANPLWSDIEFSGWVSPIAHRMVEGQRIYRDFTLPIPPASFALIALVQSALGRFLLLDELWVCALSQMFMLLCGYFTLSRFTTSRNATLVTTAAAPILIATPKEIAYDQTALAVAWAALALLAAALTTPKGSRRLRWMAATGFVAAFVLAFKSSTGAGTVGGLLLGGGSVALVAWRRSRLAGLRALLPDGVALAAGLVAGGAATFAVVIACGGSLGEFYRVVFVDGPLLKGGRGQAILNLLSYTVLQTPTHVSFLSGLLIAWVIARVLESHAPLQIPSHDLRHDPWDTGAPGALFALIVSGVVVLSLGFATLLLLGNASSIPFPLQVAASFGAAMPMIGLLFLVVHLVANWRVAEPGADRRSAFAAVVIAAGCVSLAHNLSDPTHRPFYDNNPIIPLAIFSLFYALDQARLAWVKAAFYALMLTAVFNGKFQRYLDARNLVEEPGYWQGLRVSANGLQLLRAADRARQLAGPSGTVMMLPEDPMFEALVGRPRPKLRGAIVFVDQFPERLLAQDAAQLAINPPEVMILHPRDPVAWNRVYAIWNLKSAAARLQNDFKSAQIDTAYSLDSSYETWMFQGPGLMDLYVRRHDPR